VITFAISSWRVMASIETAETVETAAVPASPRRFRFPWRRVRPIAALAILLIAWEVGCRFGQVPAWLLPTPSEIARAAYDVPLATWLDNLLATTRVVLFGFAVAFLISVPLAVALARSEAVRDSLYPILVVIQSTPVVAVAPILVVTLGADDAPRVVITAMISFFPLVVGFSTGLTQTPPELIELSRALGAPIRNEYLHIRLPAALPYVFSAVRVAITLAVIGAVVGEFVAAEKGIGYFLRASTAYFKIAQAFASLLILIALSLVLFHSVSVIQRVFFPRSLSPGSQSSSKH
jgi:NitT/TauT family transport system permease protein